MRIELLNNPNYLNKTIIRLPQKKCEFDTIALKDIKDNVCACCGRKLISASTYQKFWTEITLPLKTAIQGNWFEKVKNCLPDTLNYLGEMSEKFPNKSFDFIFSNPENFEDLRSVIQDDMHYSGKNYANNNDWFAQVKKYTYVLRSFSRKHLQPASVIIENMKPFVESLDSLKKGIYEYFREKVFQYPDKSLLEIIREPDEATENIINTRLMIDERASVRDFHFNNVKELICSKAPELKEKAEEIERIANMKYQRNLEQSNTRYLVKEIYKEFLNDYDLNDLQDKIMSELDQIPKSYRSPESFLSYARISYTDAAIIESIINGAMASEDHIIPVSDGGKNYFDNIIVLCRKCNKERGNTPYTDYLDYNEQMPYFVNEQLQTVCKKILNGELNPKYREYPLKVVPKIVAVSEGKIFPDISEYVKESRKRNNTALINLQNLLLYPENEENIRAKIEEERHFSRQLDYFEKWQNEQQ
ncbi:MAG: HNH endonuclease [bacterium]|nr:HNH endonuclease [bacterium]